MSIPKHPPILSSFNTCLGINNDYMIVSYYFWFIICFMNQYIDPNGNHSVNVFSSNGIKIIKINISINIKPNNKDIKILAIIIYKKYFNYPIKTFHNKE